MDHIRIAIRDSTDSTNICFLDNQAGIKFHEATLQRFLKGTCNFLTLKFYGKDIDTIYPGCRLAFKYADNDYWLTINNFEKNGYECSLTAYSLSLETNKEKRKAFKAPTWTFKQYLDYVDPEHSLTLGLNEVEGQSMQLEWSGTDTILARLFSIANSFGAELEFVTELNDDYSLKQHVLNVYKVGNIGKDKTGMPIRVGKSLKVINYTANIDELYTAIRVHGKDGLTIAGLDKKVYDSDKKLLYYTQGDTLYAPQARDRFPAIAHKASDSFICLESEDTEHSTKEALYAYMLGELKKHSEPKIDYETEGYVDGEIGDRMLLIDSVHYDPPLYVEARISEQTISLLDKSKNKTVFTNYERKKSEIADELINLMNAMIAENAEYIANMVTTNGTTFKNAGGSTTLKAKVYTNGEDITDKVFIQWFKDDVHISNEKEILVEASQIKNSSIYRFEVYDSLKKFKAEAEATITNISETQFVYSPNEPSITDNVIWVDTTNPNINETKYWDDETRQWISTTPTDPSQIGAVSENFAKELSKRLSDIENPILYPNTVFNSSFERFDENFKPDFWKTDGRVSTLEALSGSYSLRLEGGQTLLTDKQPITAYKWANLSTLFVLKAIGKGKIKVEVVNDGTPQTIGRWVDDKTYKSDTSFTFEIDSFNWIDSKRSVELPKTNSAVLLKITCVEGTVYLDNISAVPIEYKSRLEINYVDGPMNYNDIMTLREDDLPNAKLGAMWFRTQN